MRQIRRFGMGSTWTAVALSIALLVAAAVYSACAADAPGTALGLTKNSTLVLKGGSTLHDWSADAKELKLQASIEMAAPANAAALHAAIRAGQPAAFAVRIPVEKLTSGKDKLDQNMHKALEAKTHPEIVFTLDRYEAPKGGAGDTLAVATHGRLKVAGTERPLEMRVVFVSNGEGLRVKGSADLKMTDFGIKPPTMMLGTLRTKDEVEVEFDLGLKPASGDAS